MSAIAAVRAGMRAAVEGHDALRSALNGVFETWPAQASAPWLEIGEASEIDWGAKAMRGREVRLTLVLRDKGDSGARLERLMRLLDEAVGAMARAHGEWRVASAVLLRSRSGRRPSTRSGPDEWVGASEWRVRLMMEVVQ